MHARSPFAVPILLLVPTNWGLLPRPMGNRPPSFSMREWPRAPVTSSAVCDRCGNRADQRWTGGTAVVDPEGWVCAHPTQTGWPCLVDLAASRDRQLSEVNHMWADRRPELYLS